MIHRSTVFPFVIAIVAIGFGTAIGVREFHYLPGQLTDDTEQTLSGEEDIALEPCPTSDDGPISAISSVIPSAIAQYTGPNTPCIIPREPNLPVDEVPGTNCRLRPGTVSGTGEPVKYCGGLCPYGEVCQLRKEDPLLKPGDPPREGCFCGKPIGPCGAGGMLCAGTCPEGKLCVQGEDKLCVCKSAGTVACGLVNNQCPYNAKCAEGKTCRESLFGDCGRDEGKCVQGHCSNNANRICKGDDGECVKGRCANNANRKCKVRDDCGDECSSEGECLPSGYCAYNTSKKCNRCVCM